MTNYEDDEEYDEEYDDEPEDYEDDWYTMNDRSIRGENDIPF